MFDRLRAARGRRWVAFLALLLVGCGFGRGTAPPTPYPTPLPTAVAILPGPVQTLNQTPVAPPDTPAAGHSFPSPAYAMHLSQWWHLEILLRDLDMTRDMGFGWVKQEFPWREIEGAAKGAYNWWRPDQIVDAVERAGLKLVVRLGGHPLWSVESLPPEQITASQPPVNYADFGDYCRALAERYRGRIAAYQVWNEPNLSREWGERSPNPAQYTALLRVCYEGIKGADPGAIVISAGLAPTGTQPPVAMPDGDYLQGMYNAGAGAYFDVLGLNAPGFKAPPEVAPEVGAQTPAYGGHRWSVFRHVEDMRALMVANGDAAKQVAILEMGWIRHQQYHPDYTWFGVSEGEQADYLRRAYLYARENWQPWIGLMTTIYMADADWTPEANEQYWWSIVLPDGSPTAAYFALRDLPK